VFCFWASKTQTIHALRITILYPSIPPPKRNVNKKSPILRWWGGHALKGASVDRRKRRDRPPRSSLQECSRHVAGALVSGSTAKAVPTPPVKTPPGDQFCGMALSALPATLGASPALPERLPGTQVRNHKSLEGLLHGNHAPFPTHGRSLKGMFIVPPTQPTVNKKGGRPGWIRPTCKRSKMNFAFSGAE